MDFQCCPKCEAFNPPGATHCEQCKAELPEVAEFAPSPAAPELESVPAEAAPAEAIAAEPVTDAQPAEAPPFDAAPDTRAKVAQLEEQLARQPGANALYLQLSQLYLDGKRKDLAIRTLERSVERDPKNVYMRHRLAQLAGTLASAAPPAVTGTGAAGAAPLAGPARPKPQTAKVATATRPVHRPPPRRRRVSRWTIAGSIAAVVAVVLGTWLIFFPGPKLAVTGTFSAVAPMWSPTSRHFAFVMLEPNRSQLGVYDVGKGTQRAVAELGGRDPSAFAWSPDGRRIAYVKGTERGWGDVVFLLDVESGRSRRVADGSLPAWSPDGTTLLMLCGGATDTGATDESAISPDGEEAAAPVISSSGGQLPGPCQVNVDSGEVIRRSTESADVDYGWGSALSPALGKIAFEKAAEAAAPAPARSGDGEFLSLVDSVAARGAQNVYEGSRDLSQELQARARMRRRSGDKGASYASDVYVADFDGGPAVQLTTDGRSGSPSWTGDGRHLLYVSDGALWLMNADGSGRQQAFKGSLADPPAAELSADGRYVLFVAPVAANAGVAQVMTGETPADLHEARVGGTTAKRIANRHPFKQRYALSPDGRRIAYEVLAETGSIVHGGGRSELWLMWR